TLDNARIEHATNRVGVLTADARDLPFQDRTFDVVVSSLALHNISRKEGRERAIREIVRVLKPGGRLALLDIRRVREYASVLRSCRTEDVRISAPNLHLMVPALMVTACKPREDTIGQGAIAAARTSGARCCRSESWRRSGHR